MTAPNRGALRRWAALLPVGGSSMLYSYALGMSLQGAYFLILARILGVSAFGQFAAALAIVCVVAPFAGIGSANILLKEASTDPSGFPHLFFSALVKIPMSALLMGPLLYAGIYAIQPSLSRIVAWLIVAEMIGTRCFELSLLAFQAVDRLTTTASLNVAAALLRVVAALTFALLGGNSAPGWAAVYCLVTCGLGVVTLLYTGRRVGWPIAARPAPSLLKGFAFSLGSASKNFYGNIDKFMLAHYVGASVTGSFTAAYRFVAFAFVPSQALVYSSTAELFRAGATSADATRLLVRRLAPLVAVAGCIGSLAMLIAAPFIGLFLGEEYAPAKKMMFALCLLPVVQSAHYLLGDALMGLGRQGARSSIQLAAGALNVGINIVLIPRWSWAGAVLSTYVCEGGLALCMAFMMYRAANSGAGPGPSRGASL